MVLRASGAPGLTGQLSTNEHLAAHRRLLTTYTPTGFAFCPLPAAHPPTRQAIVTELTKLGATVEEGRDYCVITPPPGGKIKARCAVPALHALHAVHALAGRPASRSERAPSPALHPDPFLFPVVRASARFKHSIPQEGLEGKSSRA